MTEKELIGKIRTLRQIRPRKDWVVLTKSQILGEEPKVLFFPFFKPAFAGLVAISILFGIFGFAQNSLPGDSLYSIKKITEKSQAVFVSEEELPKYNLEIVSKRLEDLNKIAETNQVKKLAPALNEFEATKVVAKGIVSETIKNKPEAEAIKIAKKVALKLSEINEKEEKVFTSLGIEVEQEINNEPAEKTVIELLVKDARNSSLTEEQEKDLVKIEQLINSENYVEALELYLTSASLNK